MKKITRILFLLTPLILVGLAFYEHEQWYPPVNSDIPQPVSIKTILERSESYKPPFELITHGEVYNKSGSGEIIFLEDLGGELLRVNCTNVNVSAVEVGRTVYIRGYSYYHDLSKKYFLAIKIHVLVSYSLFLSIPGAILILIILFLGFKFNWNDFSFSRNKKEEG